MEYKIDAAELKGEGSEVIQELADMIEDRLKAEVISKSRILTVKSGEAEISKKYLRVFVKKFLHRKALKHYFKVISGGEDTLKVKERKFDEE